MMPSTTRTKRGASGTSQKAASSSTVSPMKKTSVGGGGRGGGAASYNVVKQFDGKSYTGMQVGGSHTWDYEPGVWKETKVAPDRWAIDYEVKKKRKGRGAPEGSGAPVGTEYHWYIVAHQFVKKVDANTYTTHMMGTKYKLAHKWAGAEQFNIPTETQRRAKAIELLEDAIKRVEELPPVKGEDKLLVQKRKRRLEKGQTTLDMMFGGKKAKAEKKTEEKASGEEEEEDGTASPSMKSGSEPEAEKQSATAEVAEENEFDEE